MKTKLIALLSFLILGLGILPAAAQNEARRTKWVCPKYTIISVLQPTKKLTGYGDPLMDFASKDLSNTVITIMFISFVSERGDLPKELKYRSCTKLTPEGLPYK